MQVIEVIRDRLVERRQIGVDQQMMMTGIGLLDAGRRHAHVDKPEMDDGIVGGQHRPVVSARRNRPAPSAATAVGERRTTTRDLDTRRHDRRRVRDVILVAQQQLQGVLPGLQRHLGFGLAGAEVQMVEVARNRLVERRQIGVDEQMMMARIFPIRARRRDTHVAAGRNGSSSWVR